MSSVLKPKNANPPLVTEPSPAVPPDCDVAPKDPVAAAVAPPCAEDTAVSVERGYELWAPNYDREPNPLLALEERQLKLLLPDPTSKDVLDVGCGTGRWLEKLLGWGARCGFGVDLSPAMLDSARRKAGLRGRLVRADCLRLPLRSASVDLAICSFALAHFADIKPLAQELARVARPQADLFVTDVHPEGYKKGWQTSFAAGGRTVRIWTHLHPVDEVEAAFADAGFELLRLAAASLGEPERAIFVRAGKARSFQEVYEVPAVLICHFRRTT